MSAGIAGVARMIERLDLSSKKAEDPVSISRCGGAATSNISTKGKGVLENMIVQSLNKNIGKVADDISSDPNTYTPGSTPSRLEVSPTQVCSSASLLLEKQVKSNVLHNLVQLLIQSFPLC